MTTKTEDNVEVTAEYREGRSARFAGRSIEGNPHNRLRGFSNARYRWFVGWLDANAAMKAAEREARKRRETYGDTC